MMKFILILFGMIIDEAFGSDRKLIFVRNPTKITRNTDPALVDRVRGGYPIVAPAAPEEQEQKSESNESSSSSSEEDKIVSVPEELGVDNDNNSELDFRKLEHDQARNSSFVPVVDELSQSIRRVGYGGNSYGWKFKPVPAPRQYSAQVPLEILVLPKPVPSYPIEPPLPPYPIEPPVPPPKPVPPYPIELPVPPPKPVPPYPIEPPVPPPVPYPIEPPVPPPVPYPIEPPIPPPIPYPIEPPVPPPVPYPTEPPISPPVPPYPIEPPIPPPVPPYPIKPPAPPPKPVPPYPIEPPVPPIRPTYPLPPVYPSEPYDDGIIGEAGIDYPIYSYPPIISFQCNDEPYPGYYGIVETRCQVFVICQADGRQDSFLCPNGTIFNQKYFVCDWWYHVNCAETPNFYHLNSEIGKIPYYEVKPNYNSY